MLPALVVGVLAAPPAARAWQTHLQNQAESLVYDVAIGGDGGGGANAGPVVIKLGARNGHTRWRATLTGNGGVNVLAVDAGGTIPVGGSIWLPVDDPGSSEFTVARLGPDGSGTTDAPRVF